MTGEGLIFPALGTKIEMEKGGNLGNAIPLPDRAASQMDQVCDVATALAAIGGGRVLMTLGAYRSVSSSWVGIRQSA